MPRKKIKYLSLEVVEANSTWDYRKSRSVKNFICKEDDFETTMTDMLTKETYKHDKHLKDEMKGVLAPKGTRNASDLFFGDTVNVEEVKLPASIKSSTDFVYKVSDYSNDKLNTEYGAIKDAIAYINKKIKTKYAYVSYDGETKRIENNPKAVTDILNELKDTTSVFTIEASGRSGVTDNFIIISTFKNEIR